MVKYSREPANSTELAKAMCRDLRVHFKLSDELKKEIRHMIEGKRKMCYEDLNIYGSEFAPKTFLPWLIDRLREAGKPSSEIEV